MKGPKPVLGKVVVPRQQERRVVGRCIVKKGDAHRNSKHNERAKNDCGQLFFRYAELFEHGRQTPVILPFNIRETDAKHKGFMLS